MKKNILLLILILAFSNCYSQKDSLFLKDKFIVGGMTSIGYNRSSSYNDNEFVGESERLNFEFSPDIGYFFTNKFAIGLSPSYTLTLSKWVDEENWNTTNSLLISPFLRYYITYNLFINGEVGIGFYKTNIYYVPVNSDIIIKGNSLNYQIGIGYSFFIRENISLDLVLGYLNETLFNEGFKEKERKNNQLKMEIGFQFYL